MYKVCFAISFLISLTAGCSDEQLTVYEYADASESWEAELVVEELPAAEAVSERVELILTSTEDFQDMDAVKVVTDSEWEYQNASTMEIEQMESPEIRITQERRGTMNYFPYTMVSGFIFLSACSMQSMTHFSGEGDFWKVTYTANEKTADYTIQYTGEEPVSETIDYSIDSSAVTGRTLSEHGYAELTNRGNNVEEHDEEIDVTIEWGEDSEGFILTQD
ncbi:MAG: hypothetical protein EA344_12775 [Alkalicoccus sp.]|nr:MAG: hypothetical protein EA344_12775 [Alkalicoccus sp.]